MVPVGEQMRGKPIQIETVEARVGLGKTARIARAATSIGYKTKRRRVVLVDVEQMLGTVAGGPGGDRGGHPTPPPNHHHPDVHLLTHTEDGGFDLISFGIE